MATAERNPASVRIGLVGAGFIARTRSLAYDTAVALFGDELPPIARVRVAEISDELAQAAAIQLGWREPTTDWRTITRASDIDLVDIVTPNHLHAEAAIDAAAHGKSVACEKPLAHTLEAAISMHEAVRRAGVQSYVGFVFRGWPAVALAKRLIEEGRIGQVLTFRGHYFHDYALDPAFPASWRLQRELAGAGSLVDIGSHVIDLARFLVGDVARVLARSRTMVRERPLVGSGEPYAVDVDDATDILLEFESGATGIIETNWMSAGYKTDLAFEVSGEHGAVRFTWERNGELQFYSHLDDEHVRGFRTIVIGPAHGAGGFWPVPGLGLGFADAFVIQARQLLRELSGDRRIAPTFLDGLRACEVVDAALRSSDAAAWMDVTRHVG